MIIDQLNIFSDNVAVRATGNSAPVAVMPFIGKGDQVNVTAIVTEAYATAAGLTVAVQESDTETGTYTTLATFPFPGVDKAGAVLSFVLPLNLKKKYARLAYTVTGTTATGKLFAAVTRDLVQPYEAGQYVK